MKASQGLKEYYESRMREGEQTLKAIEEKRPVITYRGVTLFLIFDDDEANLLKDLKSLTVEKHTQLGVL